MPADEAMVVTQETGKWVVRWSAMYGGHDAAYQAFDTAAEAKAWIDGYDRGAKENM